MPKGYREVKRQLASGEVKTYRYTTKTGVAVIGDPGSWAFKAAIRSEAAKSTGPTMDELMRRFMRSQEYRQLSDKTRYQYSISMEIWREKGDTPVSAVTRSMVAEMRDELLDTPGKAYQFISFTKRLMNFAVDCEIIEANPVLRLKRPKLGTHKRWPDKRIDPTIKALPEPLATACMLALYTGQRVGDIIRMRWTDYHGSHIVVSQQKTGQDDRDERMVVACHPDLRRYLDALERRGEFICLNFGGRPWSAQNSISSRMRFHLDQLGMRDYSIHGLRKSAGARMAEAGCTAKEIASVLGHRTLTQVELYTREAQQADLARSAIAKLVAAGV